MNNEDPLLVSFVVPLYFTGGQMRPLLEAFQGLPIKEPYELILVNDGSTDNTLEIAKREIPQMPYPVTLVDMVKNFGEHAAVLEGYRHARGQFVINLDDDLQNPVSEALKILKHLQNSEADVVYTRFAEKKHHWFRNLGSWITNKAACWMLDKPKDLYLSSFRGMRRELADRIKQYSGPYPYVDGLILGATNRIETIEVEHDERKSGKSGYTLRKLLRLWMNMFFNFSVMPLRMASLLGVVLCGFGCIMLGVVVVEYLTQGTRQAGWGSLMAAVSIFSGCQLLILGVMGEYIGRSYLTLNGKPQSIVRSVAKNEAEVSSDGS